MDKDTTDKSRASFAARRKFLRNLTLMGGGAMGGVFGSSGWTRSRAGEKKVSVAAVHTNLKGEGRRGAVQHVGGEIKEHRDAETGARVRRLTADGSDNVHIYFTSESFLGDGSDRLIFTSNRSGSFQHHLLEISAGRLTQLTQGENVRPNMLCVASGGRLFYFDGPVLRMLELDGLTDRVLYRCPDGHSPSLPSCTEDGRYVAFVYREEFYFRDRPEVEGKAELIVGKQRNGPVGMIPLIFRKEITRFFDAIRERDIH